MDKRMNPDFLDANADSIEEKDYVMPLSEQETDRAKDKHINNSIQIARIEEEKKEAVNNFKILLEPLKKENEALLNELKLKVKEHFGKVYIFVDSVNGEVGEYSQRGELILTRPMLPHEKQFTIKPAANG